MRRFMALQIKTGEVEVDVIKAFFNAAASLGMAFNMLEPYGPLVIGSVKFLRYKTDCENLDTLTPHFQDSSRCLVIPGDSGFRMVTPSMEGKVPITVMQSAKLPGYHRKWRGTAKQFWERQFR